VDIAKNYLGFEGSVYQLKIINENDDIIKNVKIKVKELEKISFQDLKRDVFDSVYDQMRSILEDNWKECVKSLDFQKQLDTDGSVVTNDDLEDISQSFDKLITFKPLFQEFLEYLRNKLAPEGLEFWAEVDDFKNKGGKKEDAVELAKRWIGYPTGEGVLSLENDKPIRDIYRLIENNNTVFPNPTMFDALLFECKNLLKTHWYEFIGKRSENDKRRKKSLVGSLKGGRKGSLDKSKKSRSLSNIAKSLVNSTGSTPTSTEKIDKIEDCYCYMLTDTDVSDTFSSYLSKHGKAPIYSFLKNIYFLEYSDNDMTTKKEKNL